MLFFVDKVLSIEEIKALTDVDGYIEVIVPISVKFMINNEFSDFLNFISGSILGDFSLLDISYSVNGIFNDNVLFNVRGNVSIFLKGRNYLIT